MKLVPAESFKNADKFYHRWAYVHSCLNIGGLIVTHYFGFHNAWLGAITMSFLIFIFHSFQQVSFTPIGIGWANIITIGRFMALIILTLTFQHLSDVTLFSCFLIIIALDGLDGYLARRLEQTSVHGERLDAEADAQLVMLLSWIHFSKDTIDWWILLPGGMRYLYHLLFFWIPASNFPPKRFRATIAVIFFLSLALAFILPKNMAHQLLLVAGALIIFSFGLSLAGSLRSLIKSKTSL